MNFNVMLVLRSLLSNRSAVS